MYIDQNINKLKKKFPHIKWDMLSQIENTESFKAEIENTKKGINTVKVCVNGTNSYIHSKYDPISEARIIANSLDIKLEDQHFLFFGIGLGYIVDVIKEKKPNMTFSIYEPNPLVFLRLLSSRRLSDEFVDSLKRIYINGFVDDKQLALFIFFQQMDYRIKKVILSSYERINSEEYLEFCNRLKASIVDKRFNVGTKYMLQKRWLYNSMDNFPYTVKSVNIANMSEKVFKGKPSILVSSGPSLDEEIDNLRKIKNEGLAYIFTAGSAVYKLIKHGVLPDAICAIDGSPSNYDIYRTLFENPENNVPLIFADMFYNEVVSSYNAKLFNVILEDDSLAAYYLKNKQQIEVKKVKVAPSVAIITLQVLHELQCDPIILVGQNLALKNDYYYAPGIDFHKNREAREKITEKDRLNVIQVEDVNGNIIYTLNDLDMMRRHMEIVIKYKSMNNIINTTSGGAKIEGTKYAALSDLINDRLNVPVVDPHWYEYEAEGYDMDYIMGQHRLMLEDHEKINSIIKKVEEQIAEIEKAVRKNNVKKLDKLLSEFIKVTKKLTRNRFYSTFVLCMNSLQVDLIVRSLEGIARESNVIVKGEKALKEYREFINDVAEMVEEIEPYFQEFDRKLQGMLRKAAGR